MKPIFDKESNEALEKGRYCYYKDKPWYKRNYSEKLFIREYEEEHNIGFRMKIEWKIIVTLLGVIGSLITIYTFFIDYFK